MSVVFQAIAFAIIAAVTFAEPTPIKVGCLVLVGIMLAGSFYLEASRR